MSEYRKFIAALLSAVATLTTTWGFSGDIRPALVAFVVAVLGAGAVWAVPNEPAT